MNLAALVLSLVAPQEFEYGPASGIAVLHRGRPKPLESFAREFMHEVSGSAKFRGYSDPESGRFVEVFKDGNPVAAVLGLIGRPKEEVRALRFVRIDHLALKRELKLDVKRLYFSLDDLDKVGADLHRMEAEIVDEDNAGVQQKAVVQILHKHAMIGALVREQLFKIVPVEYGELRDWPAPSDLREWLAGGSARDEWLKAALDAFVEKDASRRGRLEAVSDAYARMMAGIAGGRADEFNRASAELASALREINPAKYPRRGAVEAELTYNRLHPFGWAAAVLAVAAGLFLLAVIFEARALWWAAVAAQVAAVGMHAYGYGLRWMAAGQYPLSNHYESMMMMAAGAAVISLVFEAFLKSKVIGLAGSLAAAVLVLLADNVYQFASQSFINPLQPALMNTVWMTIHVPVIMSAYAMAMVLMILGHIHLVYAVMRTQNHELLARLDRYMYRVLQATVLLLMAGIILGAVWAGEAWGRPWGWDMKEVWSLITFLTYLAILHARFAGALKGAGTAAFSVGAFASVILCYYGVNFLFGKGLHTYGFGAGEMWPLLVYFAVEGAFVGACLLVRELRKPHAAEA